MSQRAKCLRRRTQKRAEPAARSAKIENARGLRPWRFPDAFVAHRNVHQPFQPLSRAPDHSDSCSSSLASFCVVRVAPFPQISSLPATKVSGRPAPSVLRPCQQWCPGFPRCNHPSALLGLILQVSLSPLASSFRCPGSPMTLPGQPRSTSSGSTGDQVAGRPASWIFQRCLLRLAECPRRCLACRADDVSPSILGHRILRS